MEISNVSLNMAKKKEKKPMPGFQISGAEFKPSAHVEINEKEPAMKRAAFASYPLRTIIIALSFSAFVLFQAPTAFAGNNYYVNPVTRSDGNNGSITSPWQNIFHAFKNLGAGG